jgi:hypothetical protein
MLFKTIINPDFVLYVNKKSNYVCVNFYKFYHSGLFKKSRSVWHQTYDDFTDKNNSFEGFNIHYNYYHNSSYQTHCDANDNVYLDLHNNICLYLQNCRYSICIGKYYYLRDVENMRCCIPYPWECQAKSSLDSIK